MHTAVKVICHPTTGKSKGFGFVKFSSQNHAAAAWQKMNGQASVLHYLLSYDAYHIGQPASVSRLSTTNTNFHTIIFFFREPL